MGLLINFTIVFTTKDSGQRENYGDQGGVRDTEEGKPRYDLCIPLNDPNPMLTRWAYLMARGAKKYGDRNWEKFNDMRAYIRAKSSAFRHFMQWFMGLKDEDHAAAVYFNIQVAEHLEPIVYEKKQTQEAVEATD